MNTTTLRQQAGFTLIEVMIVVMIISILAAVAIPSYRQYAVRNAESQAQARMQQLEIELNRWRASALTYKGFMPKRLDDKGEVSFGYDDSANTIIYMPKGSNSSNYRYKILLVDGNGATLAPTTSTYTTAGNAWRMLAIPNLDNSITQYASLLMTTSTGVQCKTAEKDMKELPDASLKATADCGTETEVW